MESKYIYQNDHNLSLEEISKLFNIPLAQLKELNPVVTKQVLLKVVIVDDIINESDPKELVDAMNITEEQKALLKAILEQL